MDAEVAESESIDARRAGAAAALDACRAEAAQLAEAVHARELEAGEARHRRARIVERIRDEYDIDIETIAAAEAGPPAAEAEPPADLPADRAALDDEVEELRRKLAAMTTVNLEALAEAEELATRLAGLETQLADITQAKESIAQLITRIDDESRRLLGETIETVRGHFRDLFERLFGGGQADIVLEEGVDLLETSVEIVARPPGKEPRSISLLSGGEKTMTCVALLLAIFKSRPSPFCVLDEVDAALDESNVDRFVGVIRDFLSATQFIVVTHSKKTMAAADTLYGVTQEESGVSKRVSVRFESAAAAAAPTPARAA
ncbi:MAG: AAA family ATPase [Planctomycetaceae bacterium]